MTALSAKLGGKTGDEFREIAELLRKHGAKTAEELKTEGKRDFTKPLSHGNCVRLIKKRERQWNLHCLLPFFI